MKTLLLLAGRSKRFWPLNEKAMWPLVGKSLVEHQVECLKKAGFTDITLVGGEHNLEEIRNLLPSLPTIEQKDLSLGMRGALLSALPNCNTDPVFIVSSNDIVEESAYTTLHDSFEKKSIDGLILAKKVSSYFPGGYLMLDNDRITSIVEKPRKGKEPSDLVTIVSHIHRDASVLLEELKKTQSKNDDGYEQALARLFTSHHYEVQQYEGLWHPVKYPWHLLPLLEMFLATISKPSVHPSAQIHDTAVIEGPVIIDKDVKIFAHASIVGPCYIGPHTVIGNNALVRQSSLGRYCVIGYNTEIVRSALHDHVWTHSSYIGDSIVGKNVSFGAGFITANLRLDEEEISSKAGDELIGTGSPKCGAMIGDNCRIGVRVTIGPGNKIGTNSFVVSDVSVFEDIPDNSFVRMREGGIDIKENKIQPLEPEKREEFRKRAGVE